MVFNRAAVFCGFYLFICWLVGLFCFRDDDDDLDDDCLFVFLGSSCRILTNAFTKPCLSNWSRITYPIRGSLSFRSRANTTRLWLINWSVPDWFAASTVAR